MGPWAAAKVGPALRAAGPGRCEPYDTTKNLLVQIYTTDIFCQNFAEITNKKNGLFPDKTTLNFVQVLFRVDFKGTKTHLILFLKFLR